MAMVGKRLVFADIARNELVLVSIYCFAGDTVCIQGECSLVGSPTVLPPLRPQEEQISYKWSNNATTATVENLAP